MTPIQRYLIHCRKPRGHTAGAAYAAGKASSPAPHLGKRDPAIVRSRNPAPPWGARDVDGAPLDCPVIEIRPQPKAYGLPAYRVEVFPDPAGYCEAQLSPAASRSTAWRLAYEWTFHNCPRAPVRVREFPHPDRPGEDVLDTTI